MKANKQTKIFPEKSPSFSQVKEQIDSLAKDPAGKFGLRVNFLEIGIMVLIIVGWWLKLPPEIPLLYSKPYGDSQLMTNWGLWLLPGFSLLMLTIAIRVAGKLIEEEKLLAQMMIWISALISLMALVSVIKIEWLVVW